MNSISTQSFTSSQYRAHSPEPQQPRPAPGGAASADSTPRSTGASSTNSAAPSADAASASEADANDRRAAAPEPFVPKAPLPAAFLPWGKTVTWFSQLLTHWVAVGQSTFDGLLGLKTPMLNTDRRDTTVEDMARRRADYASLCGETRTDVAAADYHQAKKDYAQMASAHHVGAQTHRAVHGVLHWCTGWFRPRH